MKKMKLKKGIVLTLIASMVFTMSAMSAFAATNETAKAVKTTKATVEKTQVKAKSEVIVTKNAKPAVKLSWSKTGSAALDKWQVFRSTKKTKGYGKALYTTKSAAKTTYLNTSVKEGTRYYYKVRGVKKIGKKTYYTKWSNVTYRTAKLPTADSVWVNGNVYTVNDDAPKAEAMAVKDGKLLYVGTSKNAKKFEGKSTEVNDLKGLTVLPGIMEGHLHMGNMGKKLKQLDVFWKPKDVILQMVKEAAEKAEPGAWIQGSGWMNTVWENTDFPSKEELDAVAPNNPVYLLRADAHMAWVNSKAIELAGITKDTPNPQGGEILKTDSGEILGCMTDMAAKIFNSVMPDFTNKEKQEMYLMVQDDLFSYGITSAADAGCTVTDIENYKAIYESGKMKIRTYPMLMVMKTTDDQAKYISSHKSDQMLYDNKMHLKGVKVVTDGSLGARSAAMMEEYSDRKGYYGELRFTDEEAYDVFKLIYNNDWQICTHTIGDAAGHQVVDVIEKLEAENPKEDHRTRIEHFQIMKPDDITRALKAGIIPSMEFIHATSDLLIAEDRVGPERIKSSYAWKTVLDQGGIIVGGTDAPNELVNPWHNFYAGVTRQTRDGSPIGGWYKEQAISREDVLKSYTKWVAYGQYEEDIKGTLEAGKLADFVIIDRDVMTCPEEDMMSIQALKTVVGGEVVYTKDTVNKTVLWHGVPIKFTSTPVTQNGVTYVPVSEVANNISATAEIKDGKAKVTYKDNTVNLTIREIKNVNYVDAKELFEGIGQKVVYNKNSNTISTSTAGAY